MLFPNRPITALPFGVSTLVSSGRATCAADSWSVHQQPWPEYAEELALEEAVTVVVQVNGRLRERLRVPVGLTKEELLEKAMAQERVATAMGAAEPSRVIHVPDRLINIVL